MTRPEIARARAFLQRAAADLAAVRALEALDEVPDEIVGFHGQQAAEKLLKAVLAAHGIDFPRTHSIRFLLDLLDDRGLAPPPELHGVTALYPFGVQLRYEVDRALLRRTTRSRLSGSRALARARTMVDLRRPHDPRNASDRLTSTATRRRAHAPEAPRNGAVTSAPRNATSCSQFAALIPDSAEPLGC